VTVSFVMSVRYPRGTALPKSGSLGTLLAPDQRISGTMGDQHISLKTPYEGFRKIMCFVLYAILTHWHKAISRGMINKLPQ